MRIFMQRRGRKLTWGLVALTLAFSGCRSAATPPPPSPASGTAETQADAPEEESAETRAEIEAESISDFFVKDDIRIVAVVVWNDKIYPFARKVKVRRNRQIVTWVLGGPDGNAPGASLLVQFQDPRFPAVHCKGRFCVTLEPPAEADTYKYKITVQRPEHANLVLDPRVEVLP